MAVAVFEWYDWLLFSLVLGTSFVIGTVFACTGGRQKTTAEYLTADRSLGVVPVTLSIYMSVTSGIMVLGNTAEMYTHGVQMWFTTIATGISYALGAVLFIPMLYKLRLTSSFEYLEMRYQSPALRKLASIFSIISGLLYAGLAMYTPATSLEAVTPIPMWATIVALGVIGTLYTTVGGIKAVVWTDTFQGVAMFAAVLAICVLGVVEVGDIGEVWDVCKENDRLEVSFDPNPTVRMSFWSVFVGNMFSQMYTTGPSQVTVQRYSAMKSQKHAFMAALLTIPLHLVFYTMTFIAGGAMFTYYQQAGCDPLRSGQVSNTNQLLSFFVLNGLKRPALPGLITALLVSGSLSSVTSSMSANAVVTWKDFLEGRGPFKDMTERGKTLTNKILSMIYGCIAIGFAFAYQFFPGHGIQVARSITRSTGAPLFGVFLLAAFFPFTTPVGVMVGAVCGFVMHLTVGLGNSLYDPWPLTLNTTVDTCGNLTVNEDMLYGSPGVPSFFQMSYQWYESWGIAVTVVVGILVSLISGPRSPSAQDPRLIISLPDRLCCYLPIACRRRLWCGVRHDDTGNHSDDLELSGNNGLEKDFYKSFEDKISTVDAPIVSASDEYLGYKNKMDILADEMPIKHRIVEDTVIENGRIERPRGEVPNEVTHF